MNKIMFFLLSCIVAYGSVNGMVENSPLHEAAKKGDGELVQAIILSNNGADINKRDGLGDTPLHCAAALGHAKIVNLLLAQGAEIDFQGYADQTPLFNAALNCHLEIVKLLLDKGADANLQDKYGETPLDVAVYLGNLEVAKLLLNNHAGPNLQNKDGRTPLYWAAYEGWQEIVKPLLDKGADVNLQDKDGKTPLDVAKEERYVPNAKGYRVIIKLLRQQLVSNYRTEKLAFGLALHDRLGESSPVSFLSLDVFENIFSNLRPQELIENPETTQEYTRIYEQQAQQPH